MLSREAAQKNRRIPVPQKKFLLMWDSGEKVTWGELPYDPPLLFCSLDTVQFPTMKALMKDLSKRAGMKPPVWIEQFGKGGHLHKMRIVVEITEVMEFSNTNDEGNVLLELCYSCDEDDE